MKNKLSLDLIRSIQARNILRGMLANPNPAAIRNGLTKIAGSCSSDDYKLSLEIIRKSQLFRSHEFGRHFLKKFSKPFNFPIYSESEIIANINQNKDKILDLLAVTKDILEAISQHNHDSAYNHIQDLHSKGGVSILMVRLAYYIKNRSNQNSLVKHIELLLENIQVGNIRYPHLAIRELSSPNTEYLNIREKIEIAEKNPMSMIAKSFIDHVPRSEQQFLDYLNAFFSISLIDACVYYLLVARSKIFAKYEKIDGEITNKYTELSRLRPPRTFRDTDDPGLEFFRDSFLLIELNECYSYRICHSALYNNIEEKIFRRIPLEHELLQGYFKDVTNFEDVSKFSESTINVHEDSYRWFEKSNALMYLLELSDGVVDDEDGFVKLMSSTRDIGTICQNRYLLTMSNNAITLEFRLVVACLAYIKSRTQLHEHELRRVIQEIAIGKFDSDLVRLLNHLYSKSPSVTEHLIQVLDETFLTKLFQMVDRPNAAIELRAKIFEWYGEKVGDLTYLDRAKNLRIDVQINREKGTIDDARIYVHPVKFTQWITDNLLDELSILVAEICSKNEPSVVAINWDKVKSGMTNIEQVGAILVLAYEEFCANNKFGIASYIGRRIRHGTLKGTGFTDIKAFSSRESFAKLFTNTEFENCFNTWLYEYENCLDQLRDRYVHIQDKKKPDGLIIKDFRSFAKKTTANHMLYEVLKSFYNIKNSQEIPYIIAEYCWRLIEEDLANIRSVFMDQKAKYGVFRFNGHLNTKFRSREIQEFSQELNTLVAEKFRLIESWFNKPSIASPSAELLLLFKAVLSEIRGFFTDFNPRLDLDEPGYVIRGGAYFVIYDALFIIIYNAAKYGKRTGDLYFGVAIDDQGNFKITITSQIAIDDNLEEVRSSISSALEGDCEDALVIEGRSGIKKLRRMELDSHIRNVSYMFKEDKIVASFEFAVDYQS